MEVIIINKNEREGKSSWLGLLKDQPTVSHFLLTNQPPPSTQMDSGISKYALMLQPLEVPSPYGLRQQFLQLFL